MERIRAKHPWLTDTDFEIAMLGGWEPLVANLLDEIGQEMAKYPGARLAILQIKEKFGGLRFYYNLRDAPEALVDAIGKCREQAEKLSWMTCEICGEPGCLREAKDRHWFWVRCNEHTPEGSKIVMSDT